MTLQERYEAALLYADQLDEIRAAHALDCAECGYASPALEAAAIRAHDAYVIAERLKAMNLKWGQINDTNFSDLFSQIQQFEPGREVSF